jgi:hypothetical protein
MVDVMLYSTRVRKCRLAEEPSMCMARKLMPEKKQGTPRM